MRLLSTIIIITALSFNVHSQVIPNVSIDTLMTRMFPIYQDAFKSGVFDRPRDTSWQELKAYESASVSFSVPLNWLELGKLGNIVEVAFDASGLYFPEQFNNRPILTGVFLLNWPGNTVDQVKDSILKDYRSNPDRVFDANYKDSIYECVLKDNTKAYVLHTRFYRKTTQLNQSRYDLVLFSNKQKKGHSVMISVQYDDPTYKFESDNSLSVFASRIFGQVKVK